jgi:hypothetical protein
MQNGFGYWMWWNSTNFARENGTLTHSKMERPYPCIVLITFHSDVLILFFIKLRITLYFLFSLDSWTPGSAQIPPSNSWHFPGSTCLASKSTKLLSILFLDNEEGSTGIQGPILLSLT